MKRLSITLILALVASAPTIAATTGVTAISVTGTAAIAVVPDQATVGASITTTDVRADAATSRNNATYDSVVRALRAKGVARDDITLSYYNLSYQPKPQVERGSPPPPPGTYGYTVVRSFAVKVRKIDAAGSVVDAMAPSSGIEVSGVTFGIADPSGPQARATNAAVADARSKADGLAKAAGLRITGIRRIDLSGGGSVGPMPTMRMGAMAATAKVPTTFDSGNVNVSSDVNVVFTAEPPSP